MGTKNNPGKFDCYSKAEPDEPMFVLLGRDKSAADLVRLWAQRREHEGESSEVVAEARRLADEMSAYSLRRNKLSENEKRSVYAVIDITVNNKVIAVFDSIAPANVLMSIYPYACKVEQFPVMSEKHISNLTGFSKS